MDEREKIIREDYPVERLPEDLRAGLGDATRVRVIVEAVEGSASARRSWPAARARRKELHRLGLIQSLSTEQAVQRVRELRDEWGR